MTCALLLISGSLRSGSVNGAVLRTARVLTPPKIETHVYPGMADLPHFNPDDDREPLDRNVAHLRAVVERADAMLICTPEYAGGLPGAFKNLLDWTVGDVGMAGLPVGWINASSTAAPAGGQGAHDSLRKVMGYVGARFVEQTCLRIPVSRQSIGPDGLVEDEAVRRRIMSGVLALADATARQRLSPEIEP